MGNEVADNQENEQLCICPECPTYKASSFNGNVFCARGKASEEVKQSGCYCPECPVYMKYELNHLYYCLKGKSAEIN